LNTKQDKPVVVVYFSPPRPTSPSRRAKDDVYFDNHLNRVRKSKDNSQHGRPVQRRRAARFAAGILSHQ